MISKGIGGKKLKMVEGVGIDFKKGGRSDDILDQTGPQLCFRVSKG
jgi:hypothetical protein